jgi:hypothetical protein
MSSGSQRRRESESHSDDSMDACSIDRQCGSVRMRIGRCDRNSHSSGWGVVQHPNTQREELQIHVDSYSRKDAVEAGDAVHVYITKEGHAEFVQKLD